MTKLNNHEKAAEELRELISSNHVKSLKGTNEAETRLLIIDKILKILGWDESEFNPERPTSTGHYTDYRLTINSQDRLIVEAKKTGLIQPLPKSIQKSEYSNSFLYNSCGSSMRELLQQCRDYCSDCGIPYAVATTGDIWIILLGFKAGVEWGKLKSLVFHSLEDLSQRFSEFYSLISREAIKNNSLEEKFGSMVLIKPNIAIKPREYITQLLDIPPLPHLRGVETFFDRFMSDITREGQEEMLAQCYVEDKKLNEFSHDLQQLLEYNSTLDEQDYYVQDVSEEILEKEIREQIDSVQPRTVLLVGNIGAGKSTFVHRFIRYQARPKNNICVLVDLINQATVHVDLRDRIEEKKLAALALEMLEKERDKNIDKLDPYSPEVLRGCFDKEIQRFKNQKTNLYQYNIAQYKCEEEDYIYELTKDNYSHLVGYVNYLRKRKFKVWIAFDNVDRGSDSYQEFIYAFAHRLASDARCVTLITLREDTFLEAQQSGFLDVRTSDVIFRLVAPEFKQVISRRRKYITKLITNNNLPKTLRPYKELFAALSTHIGKLILGNDEKIRLFIAAISLSNIRLSFSLLRSYYTSYHSTFHEYWLANKKITIYNSNSDEITEAESLSEGAELNQSSQKDLDFSVEYERFLQAFMLNNSWSYEEKASKIFNLFSVGISEKTSHFLMIRLLAYLSLEKNLPKASVKFEQLCTEFLFLGYQRHQLTIALAKLLNGGLVISASLPAGGSSDNKLEVPDPIPANMKFSISAKGLYYLKFVASNPYYLMRAGEDTVWYNEELANYYIRCLEESIEAKQLFGSNDMLLATSAKEIFLSYLKKSFLEETQENNARLFSREWTRIANDLMERSIFGQPITQSVYIVDTTSSEELEQTSFNTSSNSIIDKIKSNSKNLSTTEEQLLLFDTPEQKQNRSTDAYTKAIMEAIKTLGNLNPDLKYKKSSQLVRVLWALEVAKRAGFDSLKPSKIAFIIQTYGKIPVSGQNIAHFFQKKNQDGEFTFLWEKDTTGSYSISQAGKRLLLSLLEENNENSE